MGHSYIWPLPRSFNDGDSIVIKGSLPCEGMRFDINFHANSNVDEGDLIFHMSNRYGAQQKQSVFNSRKDKVGWLTEETHKSVLVPGTFFTITIVLSGDQFSVAIDGHHFANFKVRHSTRSIQYLSVIGNVELSSITHAQMAFA
ncbi:putative lectin, galactoside-binding, soluble, 9 (galectin 9)-like 1 [Trypoxylus dichotomus]